MLLAIDIGNTQIVLGVFKNKELLCHWRLSSDTRKSSDEYGITILQLLSSRNIQKEQVQSIVLSCVAPPLLHPFEKVVENYLGAKPLIVGPGMEMGIRIKMDNPKEVGADRIANAVAARELYGGPAIIVDFGTATTFDVLTGKGEYIGGAIAPGLEVSLNALIEKTSMLPKIEIKEPEKAIGSGTISALQSGFYHGYLGLVEKLVHKLTVEMGEKPVVVATGGLAKLLAGKCPVIDKINPLLTLTGLRILFEKNSDLDL